MIRCILLICLFCLGCEPNEQDVNETASGAIIVNGKKYDVPEGASVSLSIENGEVTSFKENLPEPEKFVAKIIAVDFFYEPNTATYGRIITCEYANSRHYAESRSPFKTVPYVGEEWFVYYNKDGEVEFDSIVD